MNVKDHSRQHILPKTYLKHFSKYGDGNNLWVLHCKHKYKKRIEKRDSGSSIFTKNNFYDSTLFTNPKEIELFFARSIEPNYNYIIAEINKQKEITDYSLKIKILEWVIYSKIRSVSWREMFKRELEEVGYNFDFDSFELREEHLNVLTNTDICDWVLNYYDLELSSKRWNILKTPIEKNWLTSDNPGFTVNIDGYSDRIWEIVPNPYCTNLRNDTILYFPLSKEYCLKIQPFYEGEDVKLNLSNTPITFKNVSEDEFNLINSWTYLSQHSFVLACTKNDLLKYEDFNKIITEK